MKLYHNANASDVDSSSTHSNGTKWHLQRNGERKGKDADIGHKLTAVIGSGPYKVIHLVTHQWTHTDIQCWWRQGRQRMGPLLWHNLSWSSHDSPLVTKPGDEAAAWEQKFAFSAVVGCHPLIYGANVWQNSRPSEQLEVQQPACPCWSSRSLQSADNRRWECCRHRWVFLSVRSRWPQGNDLAAKLPAVQARQLPGQ